MFHEDTGSARLRDATYCHSLLKCYDKYCLCSTSFPHSNSPSCAHSHFIQEAVETERLRNVLLSDNE